MSATKLGDFARWYTDTITKSEMIDYYEDVSGCYVLRPWSFRIWEQIQRWFDDKIKELFPTTIDVPAVQFEYDDSADCNKHLCATGNKAINIGAVLSGGQAPGGFFLKSSFFFRT